MEMSRLQFSKLTAITHKLELSKLITSSQLKQKMSSKLRIPTPNFPQRVLPERRKPVMAFLFRFDVSVIPSFY